MEIRLPEKVKDILQTLIQAGFDAYAVGGCVRDSILGREPEDWDITTSARPEQIKALFSRTVDTGIEHGTVTVLMGKEGFEVTTYRIDGIYEDARHPREVIFTPDLLEDLRRRDFTINAMAYNESTGLVDAFEGMQDLKRKVIRCVGNPMERFSEDALRMMRAIRFAAQLGFSIDGETRKAVEELAPTLQKISAERIQTELVKLLVSSHPEMIRLLYETGISAVMLPEFDRMMETEQNHPHHCLSVGEHTICALKNVRASKILRLTILLHDVAKPVSRTTDARGIDHFKGHPQKGAEMAKEILRRLKFDNDTIRRVSALVLVHDELPQLREKQIRKAMVRAGLEQYPDLFEVKRADILAQSMYKREEKLLYVTSYEQLYQKIIQEDQCLSIRQLSITGRDLIMEGMLPGPQLGAALEYLFQCVLDHPAYNEKETLLNLFREWRKKGEEHE